MNAPYAFQGIWKLVQGWLDESTRKKIKLLGADFKTQLLEDISEEQLPDFLGGLNKEELVDEPGPWRDYEIVDGVQKDDIVGIRKKSEGQTGQIFTLLDFESLPNPLLSDPQASVDHFNQNKRDLLQCQQERLR